MRPDGLLYQNGDWGIYTGASVGLEQFYSDVVHECRDKKDTGVPAISYQMSGSTKCPGCGKTQPDDIQTLWALHNMDMPEPVRWGRGRWGRGPLEWAKTSIRELNQVQTKMIKK